MGKSAVTSHGNGSTHKTRLANYLSMSSLTLESECSKDPSSKEKDSSSKEKDSSSSSKEKDPSSKEKDSSSSSQEFPRIDALVNKLNVTQGEIAGF